MPRQIALTDETWDPRSGLLPVAFPAAIWAHARREFATRQTAQLPLRARLLDVLEHLDRGHLLALLGTAVPAVALDGHPDIALLAGVLFTYRYVEIAGQHRDNPRIVYFTLSDAGRRKLREGRKWWRSLSMWQRLCVRLLG